MGIQFLHAEERDSLLVMFWNVENYFDWKNDSTSVSDEEFSAWGGRHWTRKRFEAKSRAVAKSVLWVGTEKGRLPDVIGLAEVENRRVLRMLTEETVLRKLDYKVVHFDSPDPRGIDVALLYRGTLWEVVMKRPVRMPFATRDLLLVQLRKKDGGETVSLVVGHLPSKYMGEAESRRKREIVAGRLKALGDSLAMAGERMVLAMGDFNDTPESAALELLEGTWVNMGLELSRNGEGSIKFEGRWELIDNFLVAPELAGRSRMSVVKVPFLMVRDGVYAGEKPLRTYSGPRYVGGVSDHCPILLEVGR